jgi:membrane fusion protein (multidrug efflux system)
MQNTITFPRLVLAFALLAGSSAFAAPAGGKPGGFAMPVEVGEVATGTVTVDVSAVGSLLADEAVMIRPEIIGRIETIHFAEGSRVEKGAPLVSLDASEYRSQVAQSEAAVKLAQLKFNRSKDLLEKNLGTQQQYDEDSAVLEAAQAKLALDQDRLAKTVIRAPFAGQAGLRLVSPGAMVQPGQDLASLEDIAQLKMDFRIPEIYLPEIKTGLGLTLTSDAFPGQVFKGEVYAIAPRIEEASRSILLRARVANERGLLRPGMFAKVTLRLAQREKALLVPEEALWPMGQELFVYRVVDGKAMLSKIKIGQRMRGQVEVLEGVSAGDTVITAGQMKLRNEAPVMPINQPGAAGKPQ